MSRISLPRLCRAAVTAALVVAIASAVPSVSAHEGPGRHGATAYDRAGVEDDQLPTDWSTQADRRPVLASDPLDWSTQAGSGPKPLA
ncbi:hypothetical protein ACGFYQ_18785 [Streptomyces sp. NPDC048258]|uniref:hypothetical protein n=1 Tax=Streptomyces sp. NPDC048258 TaxID=3365527 RepID=UPI003712EEB3